VEIPPEPPDVGARALAVASRVLCGASTFFFLAFLFAYFYLRSINVDHMWRAGACEPGPGTWGGVHRLHRAQRRALDRGGTPDGERVERLVRAAAGAVVLGLVAIALQCVEYTVQHFGPTDGAFASVFCAWTAFYLIAVLATMYWLETQVATELRARGRAGEQCGGHQGSRPPDSLRDWTPPSSTGASSPGSGS